MAEVVVSGSAENDLAHIYDWSAEQFGHAVAAEYLSAFYEVFDLLARHPKSGERRRDTARPYRALPCRSHRVLYREDGERVRIVRVLHMAQSLDDF